MDKLYYLCFVFVSFFCFGCSELAEDNSEEIKNTVSSIYQIDSADLGDWDEGYIINDDIFFCATTDSINGKINAIESSFDADVFNNKANYLYFTYSIDGILESVQANDISFILTQKNGATNVYMIKKDEIIDLGLYNINRSSLSRANDMNLLESAHSFLQEYGEKLAGSDSPFIRQFGEDIVSGKLFKDGIIKGISKLLGNKYLPFLADIISWLNDNSFENNIFGECVTKLGEITKSNNEYQLNFSLTNFESYPTLDELNKKVECGVLYRYVENNDRQLPTINFYTEKYEFEYSNNSTISLNLGKLRFGTYIFRSFVKRGDIVKYCDFKYYFCPDLDEKPNIDVSNKKCLYVGNNKFNISFNCNFHPLTNGGLLYQGIKISYSNGTQLISFGKNEGMGVNSETINKTIQDTYFDIQGLKASLKLKVQYWYVPLFDNNTYYIDMEPIELTYSDSPSIKFESASLLDTSIIETDEDRIRYHTNYTFNISVQGSYWINSIQYTIPYDNWNNYWETQYVDGDDIYTMNGYSEYWNNSNTAHTTYYLLYLKNGETIRSNNSLTFSGNPLSSVSIVGGRAAIPKKVKIRNLSKESIFIDGMQ